MAIRPNNEYPDATTEPDSDYPYGGARNVVSPGDGTGTPWEAKLINDVFGFQQALLEQADISPNNLPETASVSQYLEALKVIFGDRQYQELDLISGFTSSKIAVARQGDVVTITSVGGVNTSSSVGSESTGAGFLPSWAIPQSAVNNLYNHINVELSDNSRIFRVSVSDNGGFTVSCRNPKNGDFAPQTSWGTPTISYVVPRT